MFRFSTPLKQTSNSSNQKSARRKTNEQIKSSSTLQLNWQQEMMQQQSHSSYKKNETLPLWAGSVTPTSLPIKSFPRQIQTRDSKTNLDQDRSWNQTWQQRELLSLRPTKSDREVPIAFQISTLNENDPQVYSSRNVETDSDLPYWYDLEKDGMPQVSLGEDLHGDQTEIDLKIRLDYETITRIYPGKRSQNDSFPSDSKMKEYPLHQKNAHSTSSTSSSTSSSTCFDNYSSSVSTTRSSTPSLISFSPSPSSSYQGEILDQSSKDPLAAKAYAMSDFFLQAPEASNFPSPNFTKRSNKRAKSNLKSGI